MANIGVEKNVHRAARIQGLFSLEGILSPGYSYRKNLKTEKILFRE